jgi:hypothetical protein
MSSSSWYVPTPATTKLNVLIQCIVPGDLRHVHSILACAIVSIIYFHKFFIYRSRQLPGSDNSSNVARHNLQRDLLLKAHVWAECLDAFGCLPWRQTLRGGKAQLRLLDFPLNEDRLLLRNEAAGWSAPFKRLQMVAAQDTAYLPDFFAETSWDKKHMPKFQRRMYNCYTV